MANTQEANDWEEVSRCAACGDEIWPDVERAFAYASDAYLCFACAELRGGVYDSDEDRWTSAPDVSDLADERRAHL